MTYVITQNCCKDASCIPVCPVECIHPVGSPGSFTDTEMLYIDPDVCIDCGACQEECPVDAIYPEERLPAELARFRDINARYFEHNPLQPDIAEHLDAHSAVQQGALRVAIVGAGPAGCYAAEELTRTKGVEITLVERLPVPFGLVRFGVAPDHQHTKNITRLFAETLNSGTVNCLFNVEVGSDVVHDELMAHHHAVIYAVGASASRTLGIPGEGLPGHHSAAEFVGWYNGHPNQAHLDFDLSGNRVVIIGNGNVSLDIARILLSPNAVLATTDIADHALQALEASAVREVVILARRGPRQAAFSLGEFLALGQMSDVEVVIDDHGLDADPSDDVETAVKLEIAREYARRPSSAATKRIVFRFFAAPDEIVGDDRVAGLRVTPTELGADGVAVPSGESEVIESSLILHSTGYRGSEVPGVPFDAATGTVPNAGGRVLDESGQPVPGVYVTGWIKRGPRGVIGTNRTCAEQTVGALWEDFDAGELASDIRDRVELGELVATRDITPLDWTDWMVIDAAERESGAASSRPRAKVVDVAAMLDAVRR